MSSGIVIHKFGGAALADAEAIRVVAGLLEGDDTISMRVVVTSALQDVTNVLIEATSHAMGREPDLAEALVASLQQRHEDVAASLAGGNDEAASSLRAIIANRSNEIRQLLHEMDGADGDVRRADSVLAYGERVAAELVAAALRGHGVAARTVDGADVIATDARHGDAAPNLQRTTERVQAVLVPLLDAKVIVVVPGFIGRSPEGHVTTLGRGGSDLTATVLARALDAGEVVLWKDVPGIMTADPRIVPNARTVATLDAREASELAYYGARVLHPRTLLPLAPGTTLRLRPFADPSAAGTRILTGRAVRGAPVRALSGVGKQAMIALNGTGMLGVPGVAARAFGALAAQGISVSLISQASSEQSICFTVPADRGLHVATMMRDEFATELGRGEVENVTLRSALTTIAVVGSGMANTPGIAARIFGAVAQAGVNIVAIAQGASERNVSFIVEEAGAAAAMRAVHDAFHLGKVGGGRAGSRTSHVDVVLLGAGRVAREMMRQITALHRDGRDSVRIVGVIDRSGFVFRQRGLTTRQVEEVIRRKEKGESLREHSAGAPASVRAAVEHVMSHVLSRPVVVDVASGDTSDALRHALEHDAHLVLANKVPLTASRLTADSLRRLARSKGRRVLHEATVGAGLPVIDTIQQLMASGDRIDSVDCSPSGTMGYLFSEMGRGRRFSDAVRDAMERGFTEPDPRDDLSGLDVARKALILAGMLGYFGEMSEVQLESLVPESLREGTREDFLEALPAADSEWSRRIEHARERGEVVRYRARATRGGVRVGLVSVPASHPLAGLDGTDNLFMFTTARYRERPLVVSGPGAGAAVTAAGVLGDVLRLTGE